MSLIVSTASWVCTIVMPRCNKGVCGPTKLFTLRLSLIPPSTHRLQVRLPGLRGSRVRGVRLIPDQEAQGDEGRKGVGVGWGGGL